MTRFHFAYLWFKTLHFAYLKLVLLAFRNPSFCLPLEKHIFKQKKKYNKNQKVRVLN